MESASLQQSQSPSSQGPISVASTSLCDYPSYSFRHLHLLNRYIENSRKCHEVKSGENRLVGSLEILPHTPLPWRSETNSQPFSNSRPRSTPRLYRKHVAADITEGLDELSWALIPAKRIWKARVNELCERKLNRLG
jgi:hypothetical protein